MLIPTVKEVPADAEIPSHQLMLRAGLIRKLASGTYSYLPLGFKCMQKVIAIVREQMNRAQAQEILMPSVQPIELWQQTGRDVDYGQTMATFTDRHGRKNVLAPTAEEIVTKLVADEINSYKQLPINLYQISFKFRDEFRPRFGVLRSREFVMKDSYSFHATDECLGETYQIMYEAYCKIFQKCGVEYVIVEAESGEMGGSRSHQFTVPCENGEDVIVYCEDGSYAANIEKAAVDPLPKQKIKDVEKIEEIHTPNAGTIEDVCGFLNTKPIDMIKTLLYCQDDTTVAVLVRGDHEVNDEKLTQLLGGKAAQLATEELVKKITKANTGFAGPIGIEAKVDKLFVDHAVAAMACGIAGANKTDYHVKNVVPARDFPIEGENVTVGDVRNATEGDKYKGQKLMFKRGIEVGQLFKLGKKYTTKLNATFLDENGKEQICTMGCYGIGINRIIASAVENSYDENGIIFPVNIAPFEVIITAVGKDEDVKSTAEKLYQSLMAEGIDVLLDDRNVRPGVKFKDADLIGIPLRVTVGKKTLAEGNIEIKLRTEADSENVPIDEAVNKVVEIIGKLKK